LDGRPYGKLLPRYAGPIAQFLCQHLDATRADMIDFIDRTFGVRVSRVALAKFLKKFGLDAATMSARPSDPVPAPIQQAAADVATRVELLLPPAGPSGPAVVIPGQAAVPSAPPFSLHGRNTPAPSS